MNVFGIGPMELLLVLVLALIFIGPAKLPEVAGQLGRAINEFRRASAELSEAFSAQLAEEVAARKAAEQGASDVPTADGAANISTDTEWAQQFATLEPNGYAPEAEFGATASVSDADTATPPGTVLDGEAAYPPALKAAEIPTNAADGSVVTNGDDSDSAKNDTSSEDAAAMATASTTPGIDPTLATVSPEPPSGDAAESPSEEAAGASEPAAAKKPARSRRRPTAATSAAENGLADDPPSAETEHSELTSADSADANASTASSDAADDESRPRPRRGRKPRAATSVATEAVADSPAETSESEV